MSRGRSRERRLRWGHVLLGATCFLTSANACSLFVDTDDLAAGAAPDAARPSAPGSDATPVPVADANDEVPAEGGSTDADSGPTNLLENGGFELGCSGRWSTKDAFVQLSSSNIVHGGAHSCQVCSNAFTVSGGPTLFFTDYLQATDERPLVPEQEIAGSVWVKNVNDTRFDGVRVSVAALDADGGLVAEAQSPSTVPGSDWSRVAVTKSFAAGTGRLQMSIRLQRTTDKTGCILLDDAELVAK